jgi:putative DNA primase/helicase
VADDYARKVADQIIAQLRAGAAPWLRPWTPGKHFLPYNPISGAQYRGMNAVWLMSEGFERGYQDARWMTYGQAAGVGAQVRRGEKAAMVQYWQWESREVVRDESGQPVLDAAGRPRYEDKKRERPRVFSSFVFNAQQIDGLAQEAARETREEVERHEQAEALLELSGARIDHEDGDRAYYAPIADRIVLPRRAQFQSSDGYYATALHELGHWTGHTSRLARDLSNPFGSEAYAREELRAEIASLMLGDELGIGHDPGQHVAYIESWIKVLEKDPREIFRAAADAEKITRYLQGFVRQATIELEAIREREFEEPDRMQVQARAIASAQASPQDYLRRYARLEQSFGGRYVGADLFKELFSDYRASSEARARYNAPVHNAAAVLAAAQLKQQLADREYPERDTVILLTGAPGAGKTTSLLDAGQLEPHVRAVYEGQLADPALAVQRVEQVLGAGLRPLIVVVHVLPELALDRTLQRYEEIGRGSSLNLIARLQADLPGALEAVRLRYGDQVDFRILDARDVQNKLMRGGWNELPVLTSEGSYEQIEARLTAHLERRRGELSAGAYTQAFGRAPASSLGAVASRDAQAQSGVGEQSGTTSGADQEALLNAAEPEDGNMPDRDYLSVPYAQKDEARQAGAKWDRVAKKWYAPAGVERSTFARWRVASEAMGATATLEVVRSEFATALMVAGLRVLEEPRMDGRLRRVPVEGDRPGQRSGAYVGFSDGHPAGYIQNFKTGFAESWKSAQPMPTLSAEERARLAREAEERLRAREVAREARQRAAAIELERRFGEQAVAAGHPYLTVKGVTDEAARAAARGELRVDADGALLIAMRDIDGKFWSLQHIGTDGMKGFARDARIEGMHALLLPDSQLGVKLTDTLIVVEGYATGLTVSRATGMPVAVAFTAHNLKSVATAYRARYGDPFSIVIAGDNDHRKPFEIGPNGKPKQNDGKILAEAAAAAVGSYVLLPNFEHDDAGTDWNDFERAQGGDRLRAALAAGLSLQRLQRLEVGREEHLEEDQLRLVSARRTGHDGESVAETIRGHEGQVESQNAGGSIGARFDTLRSDAEREAMKQEQAAERPRRRHTR